MKVTKSILFLGIAICHITGLSAQRSLAVYPDQSGEKELEIGDCFGLKTYAGHSQFIDFGSKDALFKRYFYNRPDKGRHIYKISIQNPTKDVIWYHTDSLKSGWENALSAYKEKRAPTPLIFSNPHFIDENHGWIESMGVVAEFKRHKDGSIDFHMNHAYPSDNQASSTVEQSSACIIPWGKTTKKITAYVQNNNLFIQSKNNLKQITTDGGNGIVYGQTVHRSEFGITGGLFWSPKGNKLAFYRKDEKRVKDYPIFSINERPAKAKSFKYPMAGDSSHTVTIGITDESGNIVYLQTEGPYDQYLTNIAWSPDEKSIYLAWVNRAQNKMELRKYSSQTGAFEGLLFSEEHDKYVEPEHPVVFLPNENENFIWQSERDGFNHIYVYQQGVLSQLTKGNYIITEFLGFDKSGKYLLANSTLEGAEGNALERTPILVRLSDGSITELAAGYGMTDCQWNKESGLLIVGLSNLNMPYNSYSIDVNQVIKFIDKGGEANPILLEEIESPIKDYNIGLITLNTIQNDGIDLYTRTFFPPDFDPTKKYPVVVYVYGGPHAQMIQNRWLGGGNMWMAYMASKGYIVFTLDNRGSANRGFNFENAVHRQLGTLEMSDQLAGVNYLKSLKYVDSTRIGVHGWSFGGFMTTSLMTRTPGVYKVGVAGGPVIDWQYYEIMYTERYMDRPDENPEGYKLNSLLQYAPNLEGRLLMIHGADDNVVVWQHSMTFLEKSIKASNANLDYLVYPGHEHNVRGRDRIHLYKKVSQYFFDHL